MARTLYTIALTDRQSSTGFTRHVVNGALAPVPASLTLMEFDPAEGIYLLYLDEYGAEITDTLHADVAAAKSQAQAEFGVEDSDWVSHLEQ